MGREHAPSECQANAVPMLLLRIYNGHLIPKHCLQFRHRHRRLRIHPHNLHHHHLLQHHCYLHHPRNHCRHLHMKRRRRRFLRRHHRSGQNNRELTINLHYRYNI